MLMQVWKWYQTKLATNPDSAQVISSKLLRGTRDISAHYYSVSTRKNYHLHSHDKEGKKASKYIGKELQLLVCLVFPL
jgi:hypothetical protein